MGIKRAGTCEVKQSFERSSDETEERSNGERVVSRNLAIYKATYSDARQQQGCTLNKSAEAFDPTFTVSIFSLPGDQAEHSEQLIMETESMQ